MQKFDMISGCPQIGLKNGELLSYLDAQAVERNMKARGFADDVAWKSTERSDLTKHVYEGGFKVWECSVDLCELITCRKEQVVGKKVLELGCGAALPSILCLKMGAEHAVAQDFNECVTKCFTKDNFVANGVPEEKYELIHGSWTELGKDIEPKTTDLILTSETIYNEDDYAVLHDSCDLALTEEGQVWLAAKFFYFGVGGSVPGFLQYVKERGVFSSEEIFSTEDGVPRKIVQLKRVRE